MLFYKTNKEILEEFDKRVFGHTEAKKVLITLVNRSKMRHKQKFEDCLPNNDLLSPMRCLLIGESGTGKTYMVQQLAEMLDFPLVYLASTQLRPGAGKGNGELSADGVMDLIEDNAKIYLNSQAHKGYSNSLEGLIDKTVVVIDEADKLACSYESSGNWNKHIQHSFLTLIENYGDFAGVSFIFAGAFSDLKIGNSRSSGIGFNRTVEEKPSQLLEEELIKYGLIPELVGRLTNIVQLDKFTREDYYRILTMELIPNKLYDLVNFNNSTIELTEEQLNQIVDKAVKSGQGVRFLKRELDKLCLDIEFSYEDRSNSIKMLEVIDDSIKFIDDMTEEELREFKV